MGTVDKYGTVINGNGQCLAIESSQLLAVGQIRAVADGSIDNCTSSATFIDGGGLRHTMVFEDSWKAALLGAKRVTSLNPSTASTRPA